MLLLLSIFSWRRETLLLPEGSAPRLGLFCACVMDKAPARVGLLGAEGSWDGSWDAGWTPWGLRGGRQGWSQHGRWAGRLIPAQPEAGWQTGLVHAPGAGWTPALVWKLFGRVHAALTQSRTRHQGRARVCRLSGRRQTCLHAGVPTGRGQRGDGNRNVLTFT